MISRTESLPTWDLTDLYAGIDDPRLEADMAAVNQEAADFEARFRGTLAVADLDASHLRQALDAYEALLRREYRPQAFAMLVYSTDTRDPARGALLQRTREFGSAVAARLVFFELEIARIPSAAYDAAIAREELAPYRHYVEHQRRLARHNLSEPEERILVETANSRGQAFARLFTEVTGRTKYRLELYGAQEELNQSELLALFYSPDRPRRAAAATALTEGLRANAHVCTFVYNTLLHEKDVLDRLRAHAAPESSRHLDNELDPAVVDTVVSVCVANYGIVADYYRLKRHLLGLDTLTHYDRYAPITGEQSELPFAQAQSLVLDAFGQFSPRLAEIATTFFARRWIDAEVADGKRGGAFCAAITPELHPYVLMNYTGQARDVATLAHELGHGIHDVLAAGNHLLDYHPVLPMAETASTFAEMLVFDHLQRALTSDSERLALVCGRIEDSFATVFRQTAMFRFEQQAHRARREQGELATDKLNALWQSCMQEMFADSLTLGEDHAWWWLYIPHVISTPFYVYAYAFGELLVLSLYARYAQEGPSFVERYFSLLAAGGSCAPADLLARLGIDVADRAFWQGGCDLIRDRVALASRLAGWPGGISPAAGPL